MKQPEPPLIDEDMRAVLDHDERFLAARRFDQLSAEQQLAVNDELALHWSSERPPVALVTSEAIVVSGRPVELRTFFPKNDMSESYIVWVHGGGWKEGSLDGYERLMRILANAARCAVVGIGYTKAPGAQFPAQLEELHSAFRHISETLLPDRRQRSIAGYSAGANLILAALSAYSDDLGRGYFQRACLACGVYDCDFETPSYRQYDGQFGSSKARMLDILETYAPGAVSRRDPLVFPLHARQDVCNDFYILSAQHDLLTDESDRLVASLRAQGKTVAAQEVRGVTHIFLQRSMRLPVACRTIEDMGLYLAGSQALDTRCRGAL